MKKFEDLQAKILHNILPLNSQLDQYKDSLVRRKEYIQTAKVLLKVFSCVVAIAAAYLIYTWFPERAAANKIVELNAGDGKQITMPFSVFVTTLDLFRVFGPALTGAFIGYIMLSFTDEFVPSTKKIDGNIKRVEREKTEMINLFLRPIILDLFQKALAEFELPNVKSVMEKLKTDMENAETLGSVSKKLFLFCGKDLEGEYAKLAEREFYLDSIYLLDEAPADKRGEDGFFVLIEVNQIIPNKEHSFFMEEKKIIFQIKEEYL